MQIWSRTADQAEPLRGIGVGPWEGSAAHLPALLLPLAGFLQSLFHILREREIRERGRRGGEREKGVVKRREKDEKRQGIGMRRERWEWLGNLHRA